MNSYWNDYRKCTDIDFGDTCLDHDRISIALLDGPHGFLPTIYGARHAFKSTGQMDSRKHGIVFYLGDADRKVIQKLHRHGNDAGLKFLRHIQVWLDIQASRSFWQQMATYSIGAEYQSESTMHTWNKGEVTAKDFAGYVTNTQLRYLNNCIQQHRFQDFKDNLPESYLQTREVCINYMTLRRICIQREQHRLTEWQIFIAWVKENLPYFMDLCFSTD